MHEWSSLSRNQFYVICCEVVYYDNIFIFAWRTALCCVLIPIDYVLRIQKMIILFGCSAVWVLKEKNSLFRSAVDHATEYTKFLQIDLFSKFIMFTF